MSNKKLLNINNNLKKRYIVIYKKSVPIADTATQQTNPYT